MENNKPIIFIYACNPAYEILKEVTAGIEEEGVMFKIIECKDDNAPEAYAMEAAKASMLEAGIGMRMRDLCFNQITLKSRRPILSIKDADKRAARSFGSNAAKFIKGCSLKF